MRLLSFSFLIASLAFALPVKSADHKLLTPDTFNKSIATGYWFVEHFSPYCHHCKEFAPTWDQLVEDYVGSRVNLAQVDCVVHGDLCTENGVNGYPQMNMYRDGTLQATFKGARSHERIVNFIKEQTGVSEPSRSASPPEISEHDLQTPHSERNSHGEVLALTPETFPSVIADGDVFVKFFAHGGPFRSRTFRGRCGHCKKLAPTWVQLAKELQHNVTVAEVNCEDHKSLCSKQGVTGFPMLFFYPASGKKVEYTGNRKLESLKGWVERAIKPVFLELPYAEFEQTVKDNLALYIVLNAPGVSLPSSLSQAARPMLGSPPIYTSSAPELYKHFSLPVTSDSFMLIALKDGDTSPAAQLSFNAQTSSGDLGKWLQIHRLPSSMELGEDQSTVVLTSVTASGTEHDHIVETAQKLATQWRKTGAAQHTPAYGAREVVFAWMDQERWKSWLKSMYGIKGPAQVVITDHSRLVYFDTTKAGSKLTLDAASTLNVRHSENIIERLARYINNRFIAIENMVSEHPWVTLGFFAMGVLVIFWIIKRLFVDEENYTTHYPKSGKAARLD
ncbi:thioredoxin-domain-containing protein [Multifurca ochricompacta]|uniref:Thioredoxin-domain-containing protein n=1 Tax=Multifurca ochricompacta TaxID=376703 RepID=A0AAD4M4U6_9AGAM|nr:thioredoxin-domain-containing protein [Multifurca ochricompacta]